MPQANPEGANGWYHSLVNFSPSANEWEDPVVNYGDAK